MPLGGLCIPEGAQHPDAHEPPTLVALCLVVMSGEGVEREAVLGWWGLLRAWLLRVCLRAAVGRGLVWARGRRRSCAAVSPGKVFSRSFMFAFIAAFVHVKTASLQDAECVVVR